MKQKQENNSVRTSQEVAKVASKKLSDPKSVEKVKTLAGSSLVNRKKVTKK